MTLKQFETLSRQFPELAKLVIAQIQLDGKVVWTAVQDVEYLRERGEVRLI